jgi:hypothetical protein
MLEMAVAESLPPMGIPEEAWKKIPEPMRQAFRTLSTTGKTVHGGQGGRSENWQEREEGC